MPITVETSFEKFPNEILVKIFSFLDPRSFIRMSMVNRRLNSICKDRKLCKSMFTEHFPIEVAEVEWKKCEGIVSDYDYCKMLVNAYKNRVKLAKPTKPHEHSAYARLIS